MVMVRVLGQEQAVVIKLTLVVTSWAGSDSAGFYATPLARDESSDLDDIQSYIYSIVQRYDVVVVLRVRSRHEAVCVFL